MSSINATSMTGWIPQHWRRSLVAYVLLLAMVAAANAHLAQTRAYDDAVPGRYSRATDANSVTTPDEHRNGNPDRLSGHQ